MEYIIAYEAVSKIFVNFISNQILLADRMKVYEMCMEFGTYGEDRNYYRILVGKTEG